MAATAGAKPTKSRYLPWLALALILGILGAAIFLAVGHLRQVIVEQIARQDGYVLHAASRIQQIDPELASDPELRPFAIEKQALEAAALLTNIIAMRLFDSEGEQQMVIPPTVQDGELSRQEFARASQLDLVSEFIDSVPLRTVFFSIDNDEVAPLLRVLVPLQAEGAFIGVAEFLMDGRNVQAALRALDRDLWRYGLFVFAVGGGLVALTFAFAIQRLQKANLLLEQRTRSLLRANDELTMAAKTSALGAITAHLIHDLKNPLFGLKNFVSAKQSGAGEDGDDWRLALSTTDRMQRMINDVVRILQEEKTTEHYEMTLDETLALVRGKIEAAARNGGVKLSIEGGPEAVFTNREANIVALILANLAHNAVQALPPGGEICVGTRREESGLAIELRDNGPGLPESVRATLFTPTRSTKSGGTGLGLAISKQLANHIGADLILKCTGEQGTTFELRLPEESLAGAPERV